MMRETLEKETDLEGTQQTIRACDALLRQIESIGGLADRHGCAFVLVGHMNKATMMKANYRGLKKYKLDHYEIRIIIFALNELRN